jgi:hypothetical protein
MANNFVARCGKSAPSQCKSHRSGKESGHLPAFIVGRGQHVILELLARSTFQTLSYHLGIDAYRFNLHQNCSTWNANLSLLLVLLHVLHVRT